ncbi:hypothetical protein [Neisseria weaveri]|uniref:Uncharacterized protein n=1 Tax=Neisseria weaveri TaxID=28091 RepID=A0A448VJF0_9NEIS|nr:hypothetical protein [Neisseria weaveri]EGV35377.1 hypothetical protein l11_20330 [Neisseria weaveri LMG 5135]EGV35912.1 hypothetical protein l13_12520 [Neisseria weaveri ATCC 51223]SAY51208.1 Uncharacterised protein [Neisseria weaveri]VEJ49896.1 Uncharacterised protein [Neisseria weaveri]
MKHLLTLSIVLACAACGSVKAVRPEAPAPAIAETPSYTIQYQTGKGKQRIVAHYLNGHSPLTVELRQGNTVETLTQINAWSKGAEYANKTTRWHVQEGFATLTRKGKKTIFNEIE